jgi:xanthine/CO dehydrogenase XdhC/CoxF family maturation factor
MLIWPDGKTIGSLSAGCLEEEVTLRAREVFETGEAALISFDTRRRFGCAGRIDIFIERVSENFFCGSGRGSGCQTHLLCDYKVPRFYNHGGPSIRCECQRVCVDKRIHFPT